MTVTIGADPEFFVRRDSYSNTVIPCVGLIPGTKENPTPLNQEGLFVHEDNVCAELGIPPCTTAQEFARLIHDGKSFITKKYLSKQGLVLCCYASHSFPSRDLESAQAQRFGCDPDFDAYTNGKMREVPQVLQAGNTRYAGGHIHIGGDFNCPPFVAALFADIWLSLLPLTSEHASTSYMCNAPATARNEWYGRPGIFRPKPYGIEYRTPSNWWCSSTAGSMYVAYQALSLARFLESTSAQKLREYVRAIDWLALQEFISSPGSQKTPRADKAKRLYSKISNILEGIV